MTGRDGAERDTSMYLSGGDAPIIIDCRHTSESGGCDWTLRRLGDGPSRVRLRGHDREAEDALCLGLLPVLREAREAGLICTFGKDVCGDHVDPTLVDDAFSRDPATSLRATRALEATAARLFVERGVYWLINGQDSREWREWPMQSAYMLPSTGLSEAPERFRLTLEVQSAVPGRWSQRAGWRATAYLFDERTGRDVEDACWGPDGRLARGALPPLRHSWAAVQADLRASALAAASDGMEIQHERAARLAPDAASLIASARAAGAGRHAGPAAPDVARDGRRRTL